MGPLARGDPISTEEDAGDTRADGSASPLQGLPAGSSQPYDSREQWTLKTKAVAPLVKGMGTCRSACQSRALTVENQV